MEGCSIYPWWEGSFSPLLCIRQDEKGRQSSLICSCRKVVFIVDGWINKMRQIHATEYYSALEKKDIGSVWSQQRPQWLLSFLARFAISPSLLETWSPTRLPVASSQCSVTWKCVSRLHQRMWSSTRRRCSSAWWRHEPHAGGGWEVLVGEDLRRCHATLVTGLPHKEVMLPVRPGRARRGPGKPESAPLKSRAICASFKDTVEEKLMGIKYDYKQTAPRRSRTLHPGREAGGSVLISLEAKSSWAPASPLPGASDNPRPAHRVAGCPLPARLGGCGAGIPAKGGQSLHSSCQATPCTSRTILLPPSLKVLPSSSDCFDLLISSCVEVA